MKTIFSAIFLLFVFLSFGQIPEKKTVKNKTKLNQSPNVKNFKVYNKNTVVQTGSNSNNSMCGNWNDRLNNPKLDAQKQVFLDQPLSQVYSQTVCLRSGEGVNFETSGASEGNELYMLLERKIDDGKTGLQINMSKRQSSKNLNPRITFINRKPTRFCVTVHLIARDEANVTLEYSKRNSIGQWKLISENNVTVNSNFIRFTKPEIRYKAHLIATPRTFSSSQKILYFDNSFRLLRAKIGNDFASNASLQNIDQAGYFLLVGKGHGNFYLNDFFSDGDGDGLGMNLEAQLCMCDTFNNGRQINELEVTYDAQPQHCKDKMAMFPNLSREDNQTLFLDSDHDGLKDGDELFGLPRERLNFPKWGALPNHKDVFVEIDYPKQFYDDATEQWTNFYEQSPFYNWQKGLPLHGLPNLSFREFMKFTAEAYAEGDAYSLQNPSGKNGIKIHLDIGHIENDTEDLIRMQGFENYIDDYGDITFFNMGGGSSIDLLDHCRHNRLSDCQKVDITFPQVREKAYEEDMLDYKKEYFRYGIFATQGGGGQANRDKTAFYFSDINTIHRTFVHELGHTLGLKHHGHDTWGLANCKAHYLSIMNYLYMHDDRIKGFSTSQASLSVNPSRFFESRVIESNSNNIVNLLPNESRPNGSSDHYFDYDWNNDKVINTNIVVPMRGPVNLRPNGCSSLTDDNRSFALTTNPEPKTDASLVVDRNNRIYSLWAQNGTIFYRSAILGLKEKGSCQFSDTFDKRSDICLFWSRTRDLDFLDDHIEYFDTAEIKGFIYLSVVTSSKNLYIYKFDPNLERVLVSYRYEYPVVGNIALNRWFAGQRGLLALTLTSQSEGKKHFNLLKFTPNLSKLSDENIKLSKKRQLPIDDFHDTSILPIIGEKRFPNLCSVIRRTDNKGAVYCMDWSLNIMKEVYNFDEIEGIPRLEFHIQRRASGDFYNPSQKGRFWLSSIPVRERNIPSRVRLSEQIRPSDNLARGTLSFLPGAHIGNEWRNSNKQFATKFYSHQTLGALVAIEQKLDNTINFLPLADGSFNRELKTGDDFKVMESNLCRPLVNRNNRKKIFCPDKENTKWSY